MAADRFSLEGRIALVTGGTRGIGKAIALEFARAGASVVTVSRKQEAVDATVAELRAVGPGAVGIACNVSKDDEALAMVAHAAAAFGGLDILVNNAAVNPVFGPVENTSPGAFDKIIAVNVRAPFEIAKAARPYFMARGGGAIVNISSIGGVSPEAGLGIYSVSKAALISLTQVMAREWGKDSIRANAICPGLIKTDFSSTLWQNENILKHMMRGQAIARLGEPEDIASLALFLASDAGGFCTGGVYMADGGYTI
jgi:NAD(P)-dependent dehydrogenase (short-subunit alcohol dehydrogenase family)